MYGDKYLMKTDVVMIIILYIKNKKLKPYILLREFEYSLL
jgi:hypothetical protein